VREVAAKKATGSNANPLNTTYGQPPYEKDKQATVMELKVPERFTIEFLAEKGKVYTVVGE
jgi:alpha-L-fucosidase 2